MRLIKKLAVLSILFFIAVWAISCETEKFTDLHDPEVALVVSSIKIDIPKGSKIPQCKNQLYPVLGIFNDDSERLLTDQEIRDYITWEIKDSTASSATSYWECDDYNAEDSPEFDSSSDISSDISSDSSADIPWHRYVNRIRFDKVGAVSIIIKYSKEGVPIVEPYLSDFVIDEPTLTSIRVYTAGEEEQLRGDKQLSLNANSNDGVFGESDDGVCEGIKTYLEAEVVAGCVKQFRAEGTYDNDETHDVTKLVNWSSDNASVDATAASPLARMGDATPGAMEMQYYDSTDDSWTNQNQYAKTYEYLTINSDQSSGTSDDYRDIELVDLTGDQGLEDIPAKRKDAVVIVRMSDQSLHFRVFDDYGNVLVDKNEEELEPYASSEIVNFNNYFTANDLWRKDASGESLADHTQDIVNLTIDIIDKAPLLDREGLFLGLYPTKTFKAAARLEGQEGFSGDVDVVAQSLLSTEILDPGLIPQSDPVIDYHFIEEQILSLKATGFYNNDTTIDITQKVSWGLQSGTSSENVLNIRPSDDVGWIYAKSFESTNLCSDGSGNLCPDAPSDPTNDILREGFIKATISGVSDSTINLKVRRKKLIDLRVEIDTSTVSNVSWDEDNQRYILGYVQNTPLDLWAIYDNSSDASRSDVTSDIGAEKKEVATCQQSDWKANNIALADMGQGALDPDCYLRISGTDRGTVKTKSTPGSVVVTATFQGAYGIERGDTEAKVDVVMDASVDIRIQGSMDRNLVGVQMTPSVVNLTEGESVDLTVWAVYDDKSMEKIETIYVAGGAAVSCSANEALITTLGDADTRITLTSNGSLLRATAKNISDATSEALLQAECALTSYDITSETNVVINDVKLRDFDINMNKFWITDDSQAELSVVGIFSGFVDSSTEATRDYEHVLIENEVTFDANSYTYIESITYAGDGKFVIVPKANISDDSEMVTAYITAITNSVIYDPTNDTRQLYTQDIISKRTSLTIYDMIEAGFQAGESSVDEGGVASITFELSRISDKNIHIPFYFSSADASGNNADHPASGDGVDYIDEIYQVATVLAGETSVDVTFDVIDDNRGEYFESVWVHIKADELVDSTIGIIGSHELTINDMDTPKVCFDTLFMEEVRESSGDDKIKIYFELDMVSDLDASVSYQIDAVSTVDIDGTSDYSDADGAHVPLSGTATINAGDFYGFLEIMVSDDLIHEINERFTVKIIDVTADHNSGSPHFGLGDGGVSQPLTQTLVFVDDDPLKISGVPDSRVTNTGYYYFKPAEPAVEDSQYPFFFTISNKPNWTPSGDEATFDSNTGILSGKPTKDELGRYPSDLDKEILICVEDDATSGDGKSKVCLSPFSVEVETCLSSQSGSLNSPDTFGGDQYCGGIANHVTVSSDHIVDWDGSDFSGSKFSGIIILQDAGTLSLSGVSESNSDEAYINLLANGTLAVVGNSILDSKTVLEINADSTIQLNNSTFTYKGPAIMVGPHTLDISGDGVLDPLNGVVLDDVGGELRLSGGGSVKRVDVSSDDASINVTDAFTINNLTVPSYVLQLSGTGHLAVNAAIGSGAKLDAAPNGVLSGDITGDGELDITGDTLLLGGDLTIDINTLTANSDTTLDTGTGRLDWKHRGGGLAGRVIVNNGGAFRLIENSADISADIELSGGSLEAYQSVVLWNDLNLNNDSVVDVVAGKTFTYKGGGSYIDISNDVSDSVLTLTLKGEGIIDATSSDLFRIAPSGKLKIDANPQLQKPIRLSGGTLEVNADCSIDQNFTFDSTSSAIQINSAMTMDYNNTGDPLNITTDGLYLSGSGFLNNADDFVLQNNAALWMTGGGIIGKVKLDSDSAKVKANGAYSINSLSAAAGKISNIELGDSGSLTIDGVFDLASGKTLTLNADSSSGERVNFNGGFTLSGGTVEVQQSLEVSGDINVTADSSLDVASDKILTYNGALLKINDGQELSLNGDGKIDNDSPLIISQNGALNIADASSDILGETQLSGGTLNIHYSTTISGNIVNTADSTIDVLSGQTLNYTGNKIGVNVGTLSLTGAGVIDDIGSLQAFVDVSGDGVVRIAGDLDISSDIILSGGFLKVLSDPMVYGNISQQGDATVEVYQNKTLTYEGASLWQVEDHTLSLTGEGTILNNNKLVLNNSAGLLVLSGDGSTDSLKVVVSGAPIFIDTDGDFTFASLDMSEDITIDIINDATFTINGDFSVPSGKSLCVSGEGDLVINGNLTLQGSLCPSSQSGWTVSGEVVFDNGAISSQGDENSRDYSAQGILSGQADLRGVNISVAAGGLEIRADNLLSDENTSISTGANTLLWDGNGGTLSGLITIQPSGFFDISGDATMDATVNLAGGVWNIYADTSLSGDLLHSASSGINVVNGKQLTYTGQPMDIGGFVLSLLGPGIIDNSGDLGEHTFSLDNSESGLTISGIGGEIKRVDVSADLIGGEIAVDGDFTIGHLESSNFIRIDVSPDTQLDITDTLQLADGGVLNFITSSGGSVLFDNGLQLSGGKLDVSQDVTISGDIEVIGGVVSTINVASDKTLTYGGAALQLTSTNTLSLGGPINFNIDLSGGVLAVDSSADLSGLLTHSVSSAINVSSGGVLNYTGAGLSIGALTLSLSGGGTINTNSNAITLDQPNSVLNLSGASGQIDQVNVFQSLVDGKITVNNDFTIELLDKAPIGDSIIDISPNITLTVNDMTLDSGEKLKFTSDATGDERGQLTGNLTLNGGELILSQNLNINGNITQTQSSRVSVDSGKFMGYTGLPIDLQSSIVLYLGGDSSLDISLDGGSLNIESSSDLYGDITQLADSTIDILSNMTLNYQGAAIELNENTLSFLGAGKFNNAQNIILNQNTSKLRLIGTSAYISRVKADDANSGSQTIDIEVACDSTIDYFEMPEDLSIDIAASQSLTTTSSFEIPAGVTLTLSGTGSFIAKDNPVTLAGTLLTASEGTLQMDISMDSAAVFDRADVTPLLNQYSLKGTLSGYINMNSAKLDLLGDLRFVLVKKLLSSRGQFSIDTYTLDWQGDITNDTWNPVLDASVDILENGVFKVSHRGLKFDNDSFEPSLNLSGGSLLIEADSTIDRQILHTASSDINVSNGKTLQLDGLSDLNIEAHKLSLVGPGTIGGSAYIIFNNSVGMLQLKGSGGSADHVKVSQSLAGGALNVDADFTIGDLTMDALSNANMNIDISSDATLTIVDDVVVNNGNSVVFAEDGGTFSGNLAIDAGTLFINESLTFTQNILPQGDVSIEFASGRILAYEGASIEVGDNVVTLTGSGRLENTNALFLDHKDSELYLNDSAFVELVQIGGDSNGEASSDIYVDLDATIDSFTMSQDSNINIAEDTTLTITNDFTIPVNKRLIISGGGRLVVEGVITSDGSLLLSGTSSAFYEDGSGNYHMVGSLAGSMELSDKTVILDGDLSITSSSLTTNSSTEISTNGYALSWDGQSPLEGKITVDGGSFRIYGSGPESINAAIDLSGGTLDVDRDITLDSDINVLADSSIDVDFGMVVTYEGADINIEDHTLSLIGQGFFYNDKDKADDSYIVMNHADGVLRLSGENGIVNKVKLGASLSAGKILAENDFVILRLLLENSPLKVDAASGKTLIIGEELNVAANATVDISGTGFLLLHDVVMNGDLDLNSSGNLELAPDSTLKVLGSHSLASGMDLEFGDGLYMNDSGILTIADADGTYTTTFGGGVIIEGDAGDSNKRIVLEGGESVIFADSTVTAAIIASVDSTDGGSVTPNPASTPADVLEFKAQAADGTVALSWSYKDGSGNVTICRSTSNYISASDCSGGVKSYSGIAVSFDDNTVSNGVRYYYTAFGWDGDSAYSDGVNATALPTFVADQLVAYYRLDETPDSRVFDDSGLGNDGFIFGSFDQTADMTGDSNRAYVFNGTDSYFEIDNPFESNENFEASADDFSISLWMKTDQANGSGTEWQAGNSLVSGRISKANDSAQDEDFGLSIGDGRVMFGTGGATPVTIKTNGRVDDDFWHNVTIVRSGSSLTLYLDGIEEASSNSGLSGQLILPNILGVGARPFGGDLYYNGSLDEVRFYSKALDAAEVQELYSRPRGIVAYYPFSASLSDYSGFANNATATDATSAVGIDASSDGAYSFNGSAYLEVANSVDFEPTAEISHSLWAYFPSGKDGGNICSNAQEEILLSTFENSGYEIYCKGGSNYIGARISVGVDSTVDVSFDINDNDLLDNWHNIAVTYESGGNIVIYFDGVLKGSASAGADINYSSDIPLIIGAGANAAGADGNYFKGKIDEVKIYKRALSETEIQNMYKSVLVEAPTLSPVDAGSIAASWSAVPGADAYKLYRSDAEAGPYGTEIYSGSDLSYQDSGLDSGSTYYYRLSACNSGSCSARSIVMTAATGSAPIAGDSGDLSADSLSGDSFTLNWTAATDAEDESFELQYKVVESTLDNIGDVSSAEANGTLVQDWTYNLTSQAASGLSLNTDYYFNVLVKDSEGNKSTYNSRVVKISFEEFQSIATNGAFDFKNFTIGSDSYLAVANYSDGSSYGINSRIYKWTGSSFDTVSPQDIGTNGGIDWEYFTIDGESYLAVANHYNGSVYGLDSSVYKWTGSSFDTVSPQNIATNGAIDWEYFTIDGESYLAVANYRDDSSYDINSRIYKWNGSLFDHTQDIPTNGAVDWEHFTIADESYLVVANHYNDSYNLDSKIYKWSGSSFDHTQDIPTNGAHDWEYFTIDGESYLVVANYYDGTLHNINSVIYKWSGSSFDHTQDIPTNGAHGWEYFTIGDESYLVVANHNNGSYNLDSKIYKWNGSSFVESQSIATNGAQDWKYFTIGDESYLVVANHNNGSYNLDSKIYKLSLSTLP